MHFNCVSACSSMFTGLSITLTATQLITERKGGIIDRTWVAGVCVCVCVYVCVCVCACVHVCVRTCVFVCVWCRVSLISSMTTFHNIKCQSLSLIPDGHNQALHLLV